MKKVNEPDKITIGIIATLLVIGLIMISSAGIIYGTSRFEDGYYFLKKQLLVGVFPGLILMYLIQKIDYKYWKKIAVPLFFASIIFLVLVFIPGIGVEVYGAKRWIMLNTYIPKIGEISFQPSEFTKLALILYLGAWLQNRGQHKVKDVFEGLIPFLSIVGLAGVLILKQPDMGTLGLIVIVAFIIYFVSGAKLSHLSTVSLVGVLLLVMLVAFEPYRMERVKTFLDHSADVTGKSYQVNQALIAVGSGGIFGVGLGHSRQKFNYLPEPVGDSIFAVIGEEFGLVGGMVIILLFTGFAMRGIKIAKNAPDEFGFYVAIGITSWIVFQAFINISANLKLIPLTGIPLPFISYGGTSLVFLLAAVGILINISKQSRI